MENTEMCSFEKDGVVINGKLIKYSMDIQDINPDTINALNNNSASAWGLFLLHRSIAQLKDNLECGFQNHNCENNIRKIVNEQINKQPIVFWKKIIITAKDITVLITLLALILSLSGILKIN